MDSTQELKKRMARCSLVWRKLDSFWLHSHCSPKFKLLVYDSVVRSKLLYGLESLQLTDSLSESLDVFQRR
eukprot:3729308-Prorocentrum_lima.AAC.1